jgi:hypothetical protein
MNHWLDHRVTLIRRVHAVFTSCIAKRRPIAQENLQVQARQSLVEGFSLLMETTLEQDNKRKAGTKSKSSSTQPSGNPNESRNRSSAKSGSEPQSNKQQDSKKSPIKSA